ncbi:MAG: ATP-binding protein [Candidatus Omnitrophota bacterium]
MKKRTTKTRRAVKKRKSGSPREKEKDKMRALFKTLLDKEQTIKHTEEALLESIRRLRDIFEQSPIGVSIHDSKGEILMVNGAYLRIFGLNSFGQIKQQNLFKEAEFPKKEARKLRSGKVIQYEADYDFEKSEDRESREAAHILYIFSPIFRDKKVIGYMSQVQDITERKKIAESQRLVQLGRLLSDMAHEVNNPLMIISGNAELALMEGVKDNKIKEVLELILDECFLAEDIIQRLLKYSRLGKATKSAIDVTKSIDFVISIMEHQFRVANIEFKKRIAKKLPMVLAHEKQMQEVLMNIIHNSADSMPDGGVINIRVSRKNSFVKIEIEDTGEGMPQNVLNRIFEPFFTTKQKGTGLGLAVCHSIIQDHGGDLFYSSNIGKGTTATILLPVTRGSRR